MMDTKEFVRKLFLLYPNSYNSENELIKMRQYAVALDNDKVDFELLFDRIAKYHDDDFMPPSAWLREQSKYCYKREVKQKQNIWRYVQVRPPYAAKGCFQSVCFAQGTTDEEVMAALRKYPIFQNSNDWEVIF